MPMVDLNVVIDGRLVLNASIHLLNLWFQLRTRCYQLLCSGCLLYDLIVPILGVWSDLSSCIIIKRNLL